MTLCSAPPRNASADLSLDGGAVRNADGILLAGVSPRVSLRAVVEGAALWVDPDASGAVASRLHVPLGRILEVDRWTALFRSRPFWMFPEAGGPDDPLPRFEVQHLLVRRRDGTYLLIVPLLSTELRWSLEGRADGVWMVGETGDPHVAAGGGFAGYIACGSCPYRLWRTAAREVAACLGGLPLRVDKPPLPAFADTFGWCTWDAFYEDVSPDRVIDGLSAWKRAGIQPRFLVLDDGWQDTAVSPTGERRLAGLGTNRKFPGGLRPLIERVKADYGIETFLVWHALIGAWGGVDGAQLPAYRVQEIGRRFAPGLYHEHPDIDDWWGHLVGVVSPARIADFYEDYHARLRAMGVDGVKVDNQAVLEGVSAALGGRVQTARAYRSALERSAARNFSGRLMNCMAHGTETWYLSPQANLTRTSTDFWPNRPESHGLHLYTNAQVCSWFGHFLHGDWDMFQSTHAMGAYHAAGRAVSGSPVYCSDKPGEHDVQLLRRLVCADGSVLRFPDPGTPGRSCLMHNPTREPVPLTIVNRAAFGAAIGVFHARYHADEPGRQPLAAMLGLDEVPGIDPGPHILWRHRRDEAEAIAESRFRVEVAYADYEVLSLVPLVHGRAVIGLREKFVPALGIRSLEWDAGSLAVSFRDRGDALIWCEHAPQEVSQGGKPLPAAWDPATRLLVVSQFAADAAVLVRWDAGARGVARDCRPPL